MPLNCEIKPVKGLPRVAIAALKGSIDPLSLEGLEQELGTDGKEYRILVVDLDETRYVNSAGMSYLVHLSDAMARRGGALLLANPQPKVRVVFDLMGVSQFFRIFRSVDAALGAIHVQSRRKLRKQA